MKTFLLLIFISFVVYSCGSSGSIIKNNSQIGHSEKDTVRIANDSLQYEIIIVEPGFESWLVSQPKRGFYGQPYLETKNRLFVSEYNNRALRPQIYSSGLYSEQINYDSAVDYGYEVNYLLYNYFVYFQDKYNQHFIGGRN